MLDYFPILRDRRAAQGTDLSGGQQQMLAIARSLFEPRTRRNRPHRRG